MAAYGNGSGVGGGQGGGTNWAAAVSALVPFIGSMLSNAFSSNGTGSQMTPEMREILRTQLARMRQQEPLYQDVMGMARGLLPTRYRKTVGSGMDHPSWNGLAPGEDLRQPTANAQPTGRFAVPRNAIDDIVREGRQPRTPRV
jgi:hypothetical protein